MYYTFVDDSDTLFCLCDVHEMTDDPNLNKEPDVDLHVCNFVYIVRITIHF